MLIFPVLSRQPQLPLEIDYIWDTSVYHVSGKIEQRVANRPTEQKRWEINYKFIPNVDKILLENFWITTSGMFIRFQWISPENGITYVVNFDSTLQFDSDHSGLWIFKPIRLLEV